MKLLDILIGLFERGICPSHGLYLHKAAQQRIMCTYINATRTVVLLVTCSKVRTIYDGA